MSTRLAASEVSVALEKGLQRLPAMVSRSVRRQPISVALAVLAVFVPSVIGFLSVGEGLTVIVSLAAAVALIGAIAYTVGLREQRQALHYLARRPITDVAMVPTIWGLASSERHLLVEVLKQAATEAAVALRLSPNRLRGNIFAPSPDGMLRIVPDLVHNINRKSELSITIPPGEGSTGKCFLSKRPNITIFRTVMADSTISAEEERQKAHPALKWIVSVPLLAESTSGSAVCLGVLNVDGVEESRTEEELSNVVSSLLYWSELTSLLLLSKLETSAVPKGIYLREFERGAVNHYEVRLTSGDDVRLPSEGFIGFLQRHHPVLPVNSQTLDELRNVVISLYTRTPLTGPSQGSPVPDEFSSLDDSGLSDDRHAGPTPEYVANLLVYPHERIHLPAQVVEDMDLERDQLELYRLGDLLIMRRNSAWTRAQDFLFEELTEERFEELLKLTDDEPPAVLDAPPTPADEEPAV